MTCQFNRAWIGACGVECGDAQFCEEHRTVLCGECRAAHAVKECGVASSMVCGRKLCRECECSLHQTRADPEWARCPTCGGSGLAKEVRHA
jgi:hypothetical protein